MAQQIDDALIQFATPREVEIINALRKHGGSGTKAALALGLHHATVYRSLLALKQRAAKQGHSPEHDMTHVVPDGFRVRGVSTYYDKEGKAAGQWVKSAVDQNRAEQIAREAIEVLSQAVAGMAPLVPAPQVNYSDLLAVYPFGDPHFGMYAWAAEAGEDFDLDIARRTTMAAVDRLVSSAPAADVGVLLLLGDVFHMNDQRNVTPGHGHQLDVDTRFVRVLQVGIEAFRHAVLRALEKHSRVVVRCVAGNHDPQAIWSLAFTLAAYFSNEPRVTVDLDPSKFWYLRFGDVLIGSTHGDTAKHEQLGPIMATDRARDWGETKHRYWYTGHVHHQSVKEFPGVVCESFRTLAARDAYATGHGYRAGRDMTCIVHHARHGEVERHRCDIGMVSA